MAKKIYPFYHPLYVAPKRDLNAVNELKEQRVNKSNVKVRVTSK